MQPAAHTREWPAALAARVATFESAWNDYFQRVESSETRDSRLPEALRYAAVGGGKRLRPLIVIECCIASGGSADVALAPAMAVECVHTFSLVHDDLPAMDDDDLRRGRATTHRAFDEATAILAGDWLLTRAFAMLAAAEVDAGRRSAMVALLASATCDVISGQAADIAGETLAPDRERTIAIHRRKTAALFEAAAGLGGLAAATSEDAVERLRGFGRTIGLLFQIADDLLDVAADVEILGKPAGKDAARGKQTYPRAFGLAESRREADTLHAAAIRELEPLGPAAAGLRAIADRIADRAR